MQVATPTPSFVDHQPTAGSFQSPVVHQSWSHYSIIRRNGSVVPFEPSKIAIAMTKAFLAVNGSSGAASARVREIVEQLTQQVVNAMVRGRPNGGTF